MGDFIRSVGDGISGLVGRSVAALGVALQAIVAELQAWLPGPLFPIVMLAALFPLWLLRQ